MPGPLDGIKVIEATNWAFGPIAGLMLGDLGADVIKIESPTQPDAARHILLAAGVDSRMPDGRSAAFQSFNRNKRSLALNLKSEEGREIFKELIRETDIFLENYRPGAFERMGLGYDVLSEINPRLIYAAASGYGFKGEEWNKPAFDVVGQARSGFMWSMGGPEDPPAWNALGVADVTGAICIAYGMLAALAGRERRGGKGQRVEVSHLMANMWLSYWGVSVSMLKGYEIWPRADRTKAGNPLWNQYACSDGEWLMLGVLEAPRHWRGFCEAAGLGKLVDDERFQTMESIFEHREELIALLDAHFATATRAEWEDRLGTNPDLIYTRIQRIGDLPNDPAVLANEYLVDHEHRHYGTVKTLSHPAQLSETPASIRLDAPDLGEHSAEILKERLGFSDDQIADLVAAEVVA